MWKSFVLLCLCAGGLHADVRTMTLRQAVEHAMQQNPDVVLQRLDEQKAQDAVRVVRDPFIPKVFVGSGLAYSSGFPMSIEGSAPSIFEARAVQSIFNRPQSYQVAKAREQARGAALGVQAERDEVAYRTAALFLDAERAAQSAQAARRQVESLELVSESVDVRVQAGRELPIERDRAKINLARARQYVEILEDEREYAERSLAVALGFNAGDRVSPAGEKDRLGGPLPLTAEEAVSESLRNSKEIRRLESDLVASGLEIKSQEAARLPQIDLVAQYAMFAKFNRYEDFFRTFERHNGQIGVSITVPVIAGSAPKALAAQAEIEQSRLRLQIQNLRNQIELETQKSFQDLKRAQTAAELARMELSLAREQLSIALAQMEEGRAGLRQVEEARFAENQKWIAYYESQFAMERAKLGLLRHTGGILASLR